MLTYFRSSGSRATLQTSGKERSQPWHQVANQSVCVQAEGAAGSRVWDPDPAECGTRTLWAHDEVCHEPKEWVQRKCAVQGCPSRTLPERSAAPKDAHAAASAKPRLAVKAR